MVRSLDNMNLMHCRYADAADLEAFCAEKDPALHVSTSLIALNTEMR